MSFEIKKLTPQLEEDYFDFFENRAFTDDSPYRCFCQMYQMNTEQENSFDNVEPREFGRVAKSIAKDQIEQGVMQGYLAYEDGLPVGWCNANDKSVFSVLARDVTEAYAPAERHEKAVVCFEIAPGYRGRGIATALLQRVMEDAKAQGYKALDAFPDIREERFEWDCKGPLHMYEKAGFKRIAEKKLYYVMRKELI